jgi:hypothetical protein
MEGSKFARGKGRPLPGRALRVAVSDHDMRLAPAQAREPVSDGSRTAVPVTD